MKIKKIETFYIKTKIKEHKNIKEKLLSLISKIPSSKYNSISHTDWHLPPDYKREYMEFFIPIIMPYIENIRKLLNEQNFQINNMWFQQYKKNDLHEFHRHAFTNFSNVYYLEMPNKKMATKFKTRLDDKKLFTINAEEGDFITFPACISHSSPKINEKTRKTIISFNTDFISK
jgi:hypothetical protein